MTKTVNLTGSGVSIRFVIPEPSAHISCSDLYSACQEILPEKWKSHRVEQGAFEFIFARMENPNPELYHGVWKGCRIKHL